ncbi:hypothetical protein PYCC9005_002543 [Savitreella phatthalungensis]
MRHSLVLTIGLASFCTAAVIPVPRAPLEVTPSEQDPTVVPVEDSDILPDEGYPIRHPGGWIQHTPPRPMSNHHRFWEEPEVEKCEPYCY